MKKLLLVVCILISTSSVAQNKYDTLVSFQEGESPKKATVYSYEDQLYIYARPKPFGFVTQIPKTYQGAASEVWNKKSIKAISLMTASTLLLVAFDQQILDGVQNISHAINLDPTKKYKSVVSFNLGSTPIDVYEAPQNLNSVFYSIGEGSTQLFISAGFFVFGTVKKDNRALQTASQIVQAQLVMGLSTQLIKRISGRESPFRRTAPGGVWRPLTSWKEYQQDVSKYDAFPSGHMGSMMATTIILIENYPEKKWIKPVAFGLMGICGFAMINNEVHWAGDYPLALGLGYISGKATVKLNRMTTPKKR